MDMECCLLCLNTGNTIDDSIWVDSTQWQTENVKCIIEKHFWPMDTENSSGMMCTSCWRELKNFHKFYILIEKAHASLCTTIKTENELESVQNENNNYADPKLPYKCKPEYLECDFEEEILMEQTLPTDYITDNDNPLIKVEHVHLKQKRKRGRSSKDEKSYVSQSSKHPLRKRNAIKTASKPKKLKITSKKLLKFPLEPADENKTVALGYRQVPNNSLDDHEKLVFETEYEDFDAKPPFENCKKKRKNPDKKTQLEHDKMIADHLKIVCNLCQKPFDNFIELRKHFREEHKKRGFVICCKKKFFNRPTLVDHLNIHLDPNYFKCKQCEKVYSDRYTFEKHTKVHLNGKQIRNHTCAECGKSFLDAILLENHNHTHSQGYEKKFSCNECGKFFTTLYNLNYHIQAIHRNKYAKFCDICGKTINNSFKLHMQKHDRHLRIPINCDICGLRLKDKYCLKQHKNSQHPVGDKKEYSCHLCSKKYANPRVLRTHIRLAHETDNIHKCAMCDKTFKRPQALKEHMAAHNGTPLYTCPWCPKTFMFNGNMYIHRKNAHAKKWEELKRKKYVYEAIKDFKSAEDVKY